MMIFRFDIIIQSAVLHTHSNAHKALRSPSISVIETNTLVVWFGNIWYECRRGIVVPEEIFIHLRGKSWYFQRLWNDVTFSSHAFVTYIVKLQQRIYCLTYLVGKNVEICVSKDFVAVTDYFINFKWIKTQNKPVTFFEIFLWMYGLSALPNDKLYLVKIKEFFCSYWVERCISREMR